MPYVLIIHEVADYEAWKKVFDFAAGIRFDAGVHLSGRAGGGRALSHYFKLTKIHF